jgi:hypothetical protein
MSVYPFGVGLGLVFGVAFILWRRRAMAAGSPVKQEKWSANFWARELSSRGREFAPGTREQYRDLTVRALQPIRDRVARPVLVNCGQRFSDQNDAVNGATNSRHLPPADRAPGYRDGVAADFSVPGFSPDETYRLFVWICAHAEQLGIGATEFYPKGNFIHIDTRPSGALVHWADDSGRAAWEASHL